MEVAPCSQEASSHAASLLASLNLQREQAQFCDCVVRQRQNPGQLHPAHRCVLAASSPVLATILSSNGVLVELQAPCLPDTILALLLDYIYTGALPYTYSQHQYNSLLTTANYLQMDELQKALKAWQHTEVNAAGNTNASTGIENQPYEDINYTHVDTCDGIALRRTSSNNGVNHCGRNDTSTLRNVSTEMSVNIGNCRQVTYLTPQNLIKNISCTTEEVQKDQFHSAHFADTEEELENTVEDRRSSNILHTAEVQEKEMSREEKQQLLCLTVTSKAVERQTNRKEEDKNPICHSPLLRLSTSHFKDNVSPSQCSSSSSSSSPHPSCGAVPVICHSSRAAMFQLAEVSSVPPPYHPLFQASVSSSRAPDLRSGSTASDSIVESITTRHKSHFGEQSQDCMNNKGHIGTQSCHQSDILKQDYNHSNTDYLTGQKHEHSNGLSHITDHIDHHAHHDSFQNNKHTKYFRDDSVPHSKVCSSSTRRLQYKSDLSFDDFPSKHQQLDCSDCHNVWTATAAELQSGRSPDPKAAVPLCVRDSGSNSEDLCSEGEVKDEHSYSRCPTDIHCNHQLHRAETSTKDAASSQHEHNDRDIAITDKRRRMDYCQPVTTPESCLDKVTGGLSGFERCTSVEPENMSSIETTEPHSTFPISVDHNTSNPTHNVMGPSYRGHLQYHCLPQEETHLSHGYSGRRHSHPSHPDHSDQSSDEEEGGASPGYSPLRQHFATGTRDQVLLLDISAQPAELLVANAFGQKETFGNLATSVAGVDNKYRVRKRNAEGRKPAGKDQSRPGAEVKHEAGLVEAVSNTKEGENHAAALTVCSSTSVPDSAQASMSSTLCVCIPPTLSASMPTNISAHLSNPVHHPFQCSLCDRSFSQRGSLNRHVRSHLGVRPFPCPHCPMTFSRQYRVTEHLRVHQRCVLGGNFQQPPGSSI